MSPAQGEALSRRAASYRVKDFIFRNAEVFNVTPDSQGIVDFAGGSVVEMPMMTASKDMT